MNKKYIHNVHKRMKNESRSKHSQTTVVVVTFYPSYFSWLAWIFIYVTQCWQHWILISRNNFNLGWSQENIRISIAPEAIYRWLSTIFIRSNRLEVYLHFHGLFKIFLIDKYVLYVWDFVYKRLPTVIWECRQIFFWQFKL